MTGAQEPQQAKPLDAIRRRMKRATVKTFRRAGLELHHAREPANAPFKENSRRIIARRSAQTSSDVLALHEKYREPVFGRVRMPDLLAKLALCIDEQDVALGCASQLTHCLQVVEGMVADGIGDHDLLIAGLVHDLGKLMLLTGEDQANVGGHVAPIGVCEEGVGLANCTLQWSNDDLGYDRLKDYLPDHVSWLIRYHSLNLDLCAPFMDERDRRYARDYLALFSHYDFGTKSAFGVPKTRIEDYGELIDEYFPDPILF